jgi:hypothetical protein
MLIAKACSRRQVSRQLFGKNKQLQKTNKHRRKRSLSTVEHNESKVRLEPRSRSLSNGAHDSPRFRTLVELGVNVQDKHRRHRVCSDPVDEYGCSSIEAGRRKKTALIGFSPFYSHY